MEIDSGTEYDRAPIPMDGESGQMGPGTDLVALC